MTNINVFIFSFQYASVNISSRFQIETTAFFRFIDHDAKSEAEEKLGCFAMKIKLVDDPNAKTNAEEDNLEDDE